MYCLSTLAALNAAADRGERPLVGLNAFADLAPKRGTIPHLDSDSPAACIRCGEPIAPEEPRVAVGRFGHSRCLDCEAAYAA